MQHPRLKLVWGGLLGLTSVLMGVAVVGCQGGGSAVNNQSTIGDTDISSLAGPTDPTKVVDAEFMPREKFGRTLSVDGLIFPSATAEERAAFQRGLNLFTAERTDAFDGEGPYFNQRNCLGCHMSQLSGNSATPVSRARTEDAFTIFGDFNPATGEFNPRSDAGGPVFHRHQVPGFPPQQLPPLPGAPFVRVTGMRAAPPYIGRGLIEGIPDSAILALKDPSVNGLGHEGFENRASEASALIGGSPVVRLGRFGLRAAGPSLEQFDTGGTNGEIGLTSPFTPTANNNTPTPAPVPSPGLTANNLRDLRTLIRLIAPPARGTFAVGSSEDRGRILFGVDYTQPHGIAQDRMLNCSGCHTPMMITGASPARIGGSHLSNKRFYPFGDFLLHDMGAALADNTLPGQGRADGRQFRTAPLMGIGLVGPPHLHDGRVTANQSQASALREAIERHDNYGNDTDSEGHPAALAFRSLPEDSKQDLINFLLSL